MAYSSKTDRRPVTGRRTCGCDWCCPEILPARLKRTRERRAWLTEAWAEARFGDMTPEHAALPVFVQVKLA